MSPKPPRRRWLVVVPLILSLAALVAAEWWCRSRGYGGYPPVLQRVGPEGNVTWYATSRPGTARYFARGPFAGGGMRELHWTSPKPAGTVRIVFLGESAIQGYPQSLPLTNGAFLEAMLRDLWHGTRPVEVLNLGSTAVASFPVRCFLDEVFAHDPDLVVVMAGNNEFYGAYGVVSLNAAGRSPLGMRLVHWVRGLGIAEWLEVKGARKTQPRGTLMEVMGANRAIGPGDPLRRAAAASLRANLADMARKCRGHHVPLIVCTVPTNERDTAPIGPDADWTGGAHAHYARAQALFAAGDYPAADSEFVRARDLDTMPWRATSAARDAIVAAAHDGATPCDMESAFRAASPGGAIGWELIDDHVHMTLHGQWLFGRTIGGAMTTLPGPLHVDPAALDSLPGWEACAARQGRSVYSDYMAANYVRTLFDISFMRRYNKAAKARSDSTCAALLAAMSERDRQAVARWRDPVFHGATDRPLEFVVAVYRMSAGEYASAIPLLRFSRDCLATVTLWRLETTWKLLTCYRHLHESATAEDSALCADAIRTGELLERYGPPGNVQVERYLGFAYDLAGNYSAAVPRLETSVRNVSGMEGWDVVSALVDAYIQLGRVGDARRLLELAEAQPDMADAAKRLMRTLPTAP